jgi:putative spermidine/putrescine transport system ATP-binding protein
MKLIELRDITKTYHLGEIDVPVLKGVSLDVGRGELVALMGASGSGKSTLMNILGCLDRPTSGRYILDGQLVSDLSSDERAAVRNTKIGFVFQSFNLLARTSALENVMMPLAYSPHVTEKEAKKRAIELLHRVGLDTRMDHYPSQLSGGQQQRVALARALVTRPRVLLLDEPLSALDAKVRVGLREQIRRIQTELGITTLFVTHDQEEALAVADRVAVMREGRIEQIGTPEELYTTPASPFVADFVGLSNRVPAVLKGDGVTVLGQTIAVLGEAPDDGAVLAYVRPEDLVFAATARTKGAIPATVVASSFLGSLRRTSVRLDDGTLLSVQHEVSVQPQPGDAVGITLRGRAVSVVADPAG